MSRNIETALINAKLHNVPNYNTLKLSTRKNKRFMILSPSGKYIHFGLYPYKGKGAFIDHLDKDIRNAWRARHSKILKDGKPAYLNPESPEFYSWNILW